MTDPQHSDFFLLVIAGAFSFVPYVGPLAAAVPAVLVAGVEGVVVVTVVLIQTLYVQDVLGEDIEVMGSSWN